LLASASGQVHASSFWAKDRSVADARGLVRDAQSAKHNLSKTLALCHAWLGVPAKVEALKASLEAEPLMLLKVFEDLQDLERSATSLVDLLRQRGTLHELEKGFGHHMSSVQDLDSTVMTHVFANVKRCFELGTTNPQVLVMTFQVLEERGRERAERLKKQAQPGSPQAHPMMDLERDEDEDCCNVAQTLLHEAISARAAVAFQLSEVGGSEGVSHALKAASHVLSELTSIVNEVAPCVPPEYAVVILAKNLYQSFLLPPLETIYFAPAKLETSDILRVVSKRHARVRHAGGGSMSRGRYACLLGGGFQVKWLDYFNTEMEVIMGGPQHRSMEFEQGAESLLTEFIARTREQLTEWIDKVAVVAEDPQPGPDGLIATPYPNDMMRLLRLQLDSAMGLLRPERFVLVLGPAAVALRSSQLRFDELLLSALDLVAERESNPLDDNPSAPACLKVLTVHWLRDGRPRLSPQPSPPPTTAGTYLCRWSKCAAYATT